MPQKCFTDPSYGQSTNHRSIPLERSNSADIFPLLLAGTSVVATEWSTLTLIWRHFGEKILKYLNMTIECVLEPRTGLVLWKRMVSAHCIIIRACCHYLNKHPVALHLSQVTSDQNSFKDRVPIPAEGYMAASSMSLQASLSTTRRIQLCPYSTGDFANTLAITETSYEHHGISNHRQLVCPTASRCNGSSKDV